MDITVRLYIRHDLDLIGLKQNPNFNFNKYMKDAVIAWANNDNNFTIPMPISASGEKIPLKSSVFHFRLNNKEHQYVIKRLKSIRYSYRNAFLKTIFRHYLQFTSIEVFDYYSTRFDLKGGSYAGPNEETIRITDLLNKQAVEINMSVPINEVIYDNPSEIEDNVNSSTNLTESISDMKQDEENASDKEISETTEAAVIETAIDNEVDLKKEISNIIDVSYNSDNKPSISETLSDNIKSVSHEEQSFDSNVPDDNNSDDESDDFDLFGLVGKMM